MELIIVNVQISYCYGTVAPLEFHGRNASCVFKIAVGGKRPRLSLELLAVLMCPYTLAVDPDLIEYLKYVAVRSSIMNRCD